MDTVLEEKQSESQKQPEGKIARGISAINSLAGTGRAVAHAGKVTAFFTSPAGWVVLAVVIVVVITFAIAFSSGVSHQ